ncbi:MAG: 50S ribosomal protein L4 [Candidatus Omnitrophica bacterium]|nr:50S ribosomal protein L4 [Candidatus Omnitrophota bacterium]
MKKQSSQGINKIPLFNSKGNKVESLELDKSVFDGKPNEALLYQSILMYRANQRKGTASTKTRGDVRGGGKKPWRQKGTGRARFGSIRNPLWRGGGIAFGPHPRDFSYSLPKKLKRNAFISSLNAKLRSGQILAVEDISTEIPKTKNIARIIKGLNIKTSVLFLVEKIDRNLFLASRNIKNLTLKRIAEATVLDVLSRERVVITKGAAESLNRQVKK